MTTYLPIFSGILRGAGLGGGLDLGAGTDMTREISETARQDTVSVLRATVMQASPGSGVAVRPFSRRKQVPVSRNDRARNARTPSRSRLVSRPPREPRAPYR